MKTAAQFTRSLTSFRTAQGRVSSQAHELALDAIEYAASETQDPSRLTELIRAVRHDKACSLLVAFIDGAIAYAGQTGGARCAMLGTAKDGGRKLTITQDGREALRHLDADRLALWFGLHSDPFAPLTQPDQAPKDFDAQAYAKRVAAKLISEGLADEGAFIVALRDQLRELRAKNPTASPAAEQKVA